jgi:hypothetical protein
MLARNAAITSAFQSRPAATASSDCIGKQGSRCSSTLGRPPVRRVSRRDGACGFGQGDSRGPSLPTDRALSGGPATPHVTGTAPAGCGAAAASKRARCSGESASAQARSRAIEWRVQAASALSCWMPRGLRPACSASASWVRPAARRSSRSGAPKVIERLASRIPTPCRPVEGSGRAAACGKRPPGRACSRSVGNRAGCAWWPRRAGRIVAHGGRRDRGAANERRRWRARRRGRE